MSCAPERTFKDGELIEGWPPIGLDAYPRTVQGQALLDRAQEARASKRPIDPVWPVLDAVEAMADAASCLDGTEPALATKLRQSVNYVLDQVARLGKMYHAETKRQILKQFWSSQIHGLCPGDPIADHPAATCTVCNMSRLTLEELVWHTMRPGEARKSAPADVESERIEGWVPNWESRDPVGDRIEVYPNRASIIDIDGSVPATLLIHRGVPKTEGEPS